MSVLPRTATRNLDVNLKSLKIFCDVADRRSFSRGAEDNEISQSTASNVVLSLEERLGVQLLDRSTRPIELTEEGRRYYEGCRQLVRLYDELEEEVRTFHDVEARSLVVASIYSVGHHNLSALVRRFSADHPRADVHLEYLHPHRVYEAIEREDVDLGIVSYAHATETLSAIAWRTEPMIVVCMPSHPLAKTPRVPIERLAGEPYVAFERGLAIREAIDQLLAERNVSVDVTAEFDNVENVKRAIIDGVGLSILPEPSVRRELARGDLASAALEGTPLVRPLGIVHRRDRPLSELAGLFVAMLQADAQAPQLVTPPPILESPPISRS